MSFPQVEEAFPEDAIEWLREMSTRTIERLDPPQGLLIWLKSHGLGLVPLWSIDRPGDGQRQSWAEISGEDEDDDEPAPVAQFKIGDRVRFVTHKDARGSIHMGEGQIDWVEREERGGGTWDWYGVFVNGRQSRSLSPQNGDQIELVSNTSAGRSRPEDLPQSQEATPPAAQRR